MPLPLMLPGLVSAGVGLAQTLGGLFKGSKLERPERRTPAAVHQALARSKMMAQGQNRPGGDLARQRIGTTQAGTVSAAQKAGGTSAQTMATALGAQQQANRALQEQDVLDAQFQQQMEMQYLNQLDNLAREQAANWQWNEAQQFQEEAGAARGLQEAGMQGIMGGLSEISGLNFLKKSGYLNGMFGGGQQNQGAFAGMNNQQQMGAMNFLQGLQNQQMGGIGLF